MTHRQFVGKIWAGKVAVGDGGEPFGACREQLHALSPWDPELCPPRQGLAGFCRVFCLSSSSTRLKDRPEGQAAGGAMLRHAGGDFFFEAVRRPSRSAPQIRGCHPRGAVPRREPTLGEKLLPVETLGRWGLGCLRGRSPWQYAMYH